MCAPKADFAETNLDHIIALFEHLGRRKRRLRKEAISEWKRLIMLFRMGQCLHTLFKQVGEAEGYYRRARGRLCTDARSRRTISGREAAAGFAYAHSNLGGSAGPSGEPSTPVCRPEELRPARGGGGPLPERPYASGAGVIRLAPEWEFPCAKTFLDTSSHCL